LNTPPLTAGLLTLDRCLHDRRGRCSATTPVRMTEAAELIAE